MDSQFAGFMAIAIDEARLSLREGNCGFGAVVIKDGQVVARTHDTEKTAQDPTAHAELTAVRHAACLLGRSLAGCAIVCTHEPCPMCSTAILWAGIDTIAYGFSIAEALRQGRRRIDLPCREVFERVGKPVTIHEGVLHEQCSILYNRAVRAQIDQLRGADEAKLRQMADELTNRRLAWFEEHREAVGSDEGDLLEAAYRLFVRKLGAPPEEVPIVERGPDHLVIASCNFCPTLEACNILGLDTRMVCKHLTERPMAELLGRLSPRLRFSRRYQTLRPHGNACLETISLAPYEPAGQDRRND